MKNINFLVLIFMCLFISAQAYGKDISQGTVEVNGASTFFISSSETKQQGASGSVDDDLLVISVRAIYYVAPNVGIGVLWTKLDGESDNGVNSSSQNRNILGPIAGYNLSIDPNTGLAFYAGIVLIGDYENEFNGITTSEGDISGHVLGVDFKHFVADSVSVNVGLSLSSFEEKEDGGGKEETDSRDIVVGLSVYF